MLIEHSEVEEAQGSDHLVHGVAGELPVADQMRGVLANLCGRKAFGRLLEVAGQIMEGAQVRAHGTFGVVTARDFLARYLFENGSPQPQSAQLFCVIEIAHGDLCWQAIAGDRTRTSGKIRVALENRGCPLWKASGRFRDRAGCLIAEVEHRIEIGIIDPARALG